MLTAFVFRLLALAVCFIVQQTAPLDLMTAQLVFFVTSRMTTAINSSGIHVVGVFHAYAATTQPPTATIFGIANLALSAFRMLTTIIFRVLAHTVFLWFRKTAPLEWMTAKLVCFVAC